ncbi:SMP-30/gluconolactonase/LRE family protein [Bacteriovoracales bacterium]|nr:SMP-30/gluconolactonase/LRE family protein [Bacteriovoracales bacterium]
MFKVFLYAFLFFGCASKNVLVNQTFYPEGPVIRGSDLFFVEYSQNNIKKLNLKSKKIEKFWSRKGCGPASLYLSEESLFVSCYDENRLVKIHLESKKEVVFDLKKSLKGPNDFGKISKEIFLFTTSGEFNNESEVSGEVNSFYKGKIKTLKKNIHYPNGIAYLKNSNKVIVSEHLKNRLISFDYKKGTLMNKKVFLNLPKVGNDPYLGPDGLKFSKQHKSLFVAQYGGGKVYRVGLDGKINKSYNIDFKYPTNISISNNFLYITAAKDANRKPYEGKIFKVKIDF